MAAAILRRHDFKEELAKAIEREQMIVQYQPIVALDTGRIVAAEALVRWEHPVARPRPARRVRAAGRGDRADRPARPPRPARGLPPGAPLAGRRDRRRRRAAAHARQPLGRRAARPGPGRQRPRLDPGVRHRPGPARDRDHRVPAASPPPAWSASTSCARSASRSRSTTSAPATRRCRYLHSLPLDTLKIAKPFIDGLTSGRRESSFVGMIVDLARTLELEVIAEGIETAEQLAALRELKAGLGQGYFLGRPSAAAPRLARTHPRLNANDPASGRVGSEGGTAVPRGRLEVLVRRARDRPDDQQAGDAAERRSGVRGDGEAEGEERQHGPTMKKPSRNVRAQSPVMRAARRSAVTRRVLARACRGS